MSADRLLLARHATPVPHPHDARGRMATLRTCLARIGLLALLACCCAAASSSPLYLSGNEALDSSLLGHLDLLEDPSGTLTIDQVASLPRDNTEHGFSLATVARLRPGYSRSAWWLRIDLASGTSAPLALRLGMVSPRLRQVDFYLQRANGGAEKQALAAPAFPSRTPTFAFDLQPGEPTRIFIRVRSELALQLEPRLYTSEAFHRSEIDFNLGSGLLIGGLLIMSLYGLLLGAFSGQLIFILQGLCCLGVTVYEASFRGYTHLYLWPHATEFAYRAPALFSALSQFLMLAYLYGLLRRVNIAVPWPRWFAALAVVHVANTMIAVFGDTLFATQSISYAALLQTIALLAAGLRLRQRLKRWRLSVSLTLGLFMIGTIQRLLEQSGWAYLGGAGTAPNPWFELIALIAVQTIFVVWINDIRGERHAQQDALAQAREEEKSRLQHEVARRKQELDRALSDAEKIHEEQNRTLAYISHDLRAPLATIIGYARLLGPQLDKIAGATVRAIERNASYQLTLIGELLEYAKGELNVLQIDAQPVDLNALVTEIAQYAPVLAMQQGHQFAYEAPPWLPADVMLDSQRLRQVLLNLLAQATKLRSNGMIRLRVDAAPDGEQWEFRFEIAVSGTELEPPARVESWLDTGEGGGLGLFIAHRIVRKMGGELRQAETPAATALAFQLHARRAQPGNSGQAAAQHAAPTPDRAG